MERMITRKEAAAFLGISIATLDAARVNGQISYVQYVPNGCIWASLRAMKRLSATKKGSPHNM